MYVVYLVFLVCFSDRKLVNRTEEKLSVHREITKFLTVYRVCYTPIETLFNAFDVAGYFCK